MRALPAPLRVVGHAVYVGWKDARVIYTWRTWLTGWLLRVVAQVAFFALIGRLLASTEQLHYLLLGNVVMLAAISGMTAVATTTWERMTGTLPLLVAAPSSHISVFIARSLENVIDGLLTAVAAFVIIAPLFGFPVPLPHALMALPVLTLVTVTTFALATFLGALVLRAMGTRNVVSNIVYLTMMAICGVNVPVEFWPNWVEVVASLLPLTHGLKAIRAIFDGATLPTTVPQILAEAIVGASWFAVAVLAFRHFVNSGRRDGTIEFAE